MSNAFMCVSNWRAAAPSGRVWSIGVSTSTKPRSQKFSRIERTTAARRRTVSRAAGRAMRST